jgi:diacylglycerol kinase (ATP)
MARALLLHNPAARNAPEPVLLKAIARELVLGGFRVEERRSLRRGDIARLAASAEAEGFERVVACGGDGTVREAAQGLELSPVPLALIPLGTVNVLAREMGLPHRSAVECAAVAGRGLVRDVGLGKVNGEVFTFCASAGPDSVAVARVNLQMKSQLGPWAYIHSAFAGLLEPGPPSLVATLPGGERLEAGLVFAARSRRYGGSFLLSSGARLESPTIRLIAVPPPFLRVLAAWPAFLRGGLEGSAGVTWRDVESFELESVGAPCPVQADGDHVAVTPARFSSAGAVLRLVFPC